VVHHSDSDRATTTKNDIDNWHRQRGFSQIGYYKVIEGTGKIQKGRPEFVMGAHAKGANLASLGVCVVGDFETEYPATSQILIMGMPQPSTDAMASVPMLYVAGSGLGW
jgi:hypothetical protein